MRNRQPAKVGGLFFLCVSGLAWGLHGSFIRSLYGALSLSAVGHLFSIFKKSVLIVKKTRNIYAQVEINLYLCTGFETKMYTA